jgi:hypothetical protein
MKSSIRKNLQLIREEKERKDISILIVESRLRTLAGDDFFKNFNKLSESRKIKTSFLILQEMNTILQYDLISEQDLALSFKNIFGNLFGSSVQTLAEPMIRKLLEFFGLDPNSYFTNTVVSFITSDPRELIGAMGSCEKFAKLLAESLSEAFVMEIQESLGGEGMLFDFLRNSLGGAVKDVHFVDSLTKQLSTTVCGFFTKIGSNAKNLIGQLSQSGS